MMPNKNEMALTPLIVRSGTVLACGVAAEIPQFNAGADVIYGGAGADWINAGHGNDTISGEGGSDDVFGDAFSMRRSWLKSRRWWDGAILSTNNEWRLVA